MDEQKIYSAASYSIGVLKRSSTDKNNMIIVDRLVYLSASLAGISCAAAAIENEIRLTNSNVEHTPLFTADTDMGTFVFGDAVNDLLSKVWTLSKVAYEKNGLSKKMPDIQKLMNEFASKAGNPKARVWNGQHNPYEEFKSAKEVYDSILSALSDLNISKSDLQAAFSLALGNNIDETYKYFPKGVDPLESAMETAIFYAHMDCR